MSHENLKFEVILSGTYWDRKPQFSVWLDDHVIVQSEIAEPSILQSIKFERDLNDGPHQLKIRLENKTIQDTITNNSEIVKDMLLNIDDIVIDNLSLGSLLWDAEYHLDTPQIYNDNTITRLDRCVNLGWNGTYILNFSSPFYIWLLKKL
jgi:hypothetical protein